MSVKVADVDHVYDRFNGGVVDPVAIQRYIRAAVQTLGTRYVLLVGGDTYDYKNYLGVGSMSFIPSLYVPTGVEVRFAPADPLYGDVDDDGVPEVPVGRFPVRSLADLQQMIAKTLAYETKDYGRSFLAASDAYDHANGISFRSDTDAMLAGIAGVASGWRVERADVDTLGVNGARQKLIGEINQGVAAAQYFGHSGPSVWSFDWLFSSDDANALTNAGRPSVVFQWGCWNTYYVWPTEDTLGHRLMLSGDRGAAATLGATTLSEYESDRQLALQFLPRVFQPGVSIGEALVAAKRAVSGYPRIYDVLAGWTILGDPALVIEPE
jgi:hypothetical protein